MALPFIHHLKEKNPESEIIIICRDWVAAVYENHPEIDQIITISRSDIKGYFATRQIGKSFQLLELDVFALYFFHARYFHVSETSMA